MLRIGKLIRNENPIAKAVDLLALWPYVDASPSRGAHLSQVQIGEVGHAQALIETVSRSYTLRASTKPCIRGGVFVLILCVNDYIPIGISIYINIVSI